MKFKHYIASMLLTGVVILSTPTTSLAYNTSAQSAVRLTDQHILFTIDYRLGFMNRAAIAPLFARAGAVPAVGQAATIGFSIVDDTGAVVEASSVAGIVLPETPSNIQNLQYAIDYSKNSNFTLLVFAELPKTEHKYQLQVNHLPFYLIDSDQKMTMSQIDENTIKNYRTPFVE